MADTGVILPLAARYAAGMSSPVPVAEIVRSGFVEGHHYGSVVALAADGSVAWSVGAVDQPILPRSCNKPIQALAMVRLGLDLPPELLALACASHSGEAFHIDGVRRILDRAGLDESALQTPPGYPLDDETLEALLRAGGDKSPILMNCSGKHAAMLATCVVNGWDTMTYLDPEHPLQVATAETFAELTGRAGDHGGGRRLRGAAAVHLAGRAGPRLPRPGHRRGRAREVDRRGDPRPPRLRLRQQPRRADPAERRSPARSARPAPSPATPSPWPTAGRSP